MSCLVNWTLFQHFDLMIVNQCSLSFLGPWGARKQRWQNTISCSQSTRVCLFNRRQLKRNDHRNTKYVKWLKDTRKPAWNKISTKRLKPSAANVSCCKKSAECGWQSVGLVVQCSLVVFTTVQCVSSRVQCWVLTYSVCCMCSVMQCWAVPRYCFLHVTIFWFLVVSHNLVLCGRVH